MVFTIFRNVQVLTKIILLVIIKLFLPNESEYYEPPSKRCDVLNFQKRIPRRMSSFRWSEKPIENLTPQYLLFGKGNSSTPFWWFLQDMSCWLPFLIQDFRLEWFSPSEVNIWRITFWEESMSWAQVPAEKFLANLWKWSLLWGPILGGISLGVEDPFAKECRPPRTKMQFKMNFALKITRWWF